MKRPYSQGDEFDVRLPDGAVVHGVVVEKAGRFPLLAFRSGIGSGFTARVDDRALVVLRWPITGRRIGGGGNDLPLVSERIETPEIVERRLQAMLAGTTWERPRIVIRNLRAPLRDDAFSELPDDAWIQWRDVLDDDDRRRVAQWLERHPRAGVRIYGRAATHDTGIFQSFPLLQRATVQVGVNAVAVFGPLKNLWSLDLEGVPGDYESFGSIAARRTRIVGRANEMFDVAKMGRRPTNLTAIELFGMRVENVEAFAAMPRLRALRLTRTTGVKNVAWLAGSPITHLTLEGLTHVDDLSPLAEMPALEHLTVRGMWQFGVDEWGWIDGCTHLRGLSIDTGSRRKTIEVYRHRPFAAALPFLTP